MMSTEYLRFVVAFAVVIGLIALTAWLFRRFAPAGLTTGFSNAGRLKVLETLRLDARGKLVLIQRDDKTHLLLLGAEQNVVVETDIPPQGITP